MQTSPHHSSRLQRRSVIVCLSIAYACAAPACGLDSVPAARHGAGETSVRRVSAAGSVSSGAVFAQGGAAGAVDPLARGGVALCEAGKAIYNLTADARLLRFDPIRYTFSEIGKVVCPGEDSAPNSMAIDRRGVVWVGFHDGAVFHVSSTDARCAPSGYVAAQLGWSAFGMAFVGENTPEQEALYLADNSGLSDSNRKNVGLGRVDPRTLELAFVGPLGAPVNGRACELTGLDGGILHVLCPGDAAAGSSSSIAEIRARDASVLSVVEIGLKVMGSYAIAQWGGSDFVFTGKSRSAGARRSSVDRYTPHVGITRVVEDAGYDIVGAGVSACAPISPD